MLAPGLFFSVGKVGIVSAAGGNELLGYAWSDNVGWISFSSNNDGACPSGDTCATYGINIENNTQLSGYAWSSNIGWIYFGPSSSADRPISIGAGMLPTGASDAFWAKMVDSGSSGVVKGWARACSVFISGCSGSLRTDLGGWDGWISMSGTNYGVRYSILSGARTFTGFAWGGGSAPSVATSPQSLGWIDFNVKNSSNGEVSCSTCGGEVHTQTTDDPLATGSCIITGAILKPNNTYEATEKQNITFSLDPGPTGGDGVYAIRWIKNSTLPATLSPAYSLLNISPGSYNVIASVQTVVNGEVKSETTACLPLYVNSIVPATPPSPGHFVFSSPNTAVFTSYNPNPAKVYTYGWSKPSVEVQGATDDCAIDTILPTMVSLIGPDGLDYTNNIYQINSLGGSDFDPSGIYPVGSYSGLVQKADINIQLIRKGTYNGQNVLRTMKQGLYQLTIRQGGKATRSDSTCNDLFVPQANMPITVLDFTGDTSEK